MRNRMLGTWAVLIACGLLAFAGSAQAASVKSFLDGNAAGTLVTTLSDDSVETILQRDGNKTLDVGDAVRGILNIGTIKNPLMTPVSIGEGTVNTELTGIFQTIVLAKIPSATAGQFTYIFGPDPAFAEASALGIAASAIGDKGAMVLFYEDTTPDFNSTGASGQAADIATAVDGTYFMALGMTTAMWGANGVWDTTNLSAGPLSDDVFINSAGETWQTEDNTQDPPLTSGTIGNADFALNRLFSGVMVGSFDGVTLALLTNPFGFLLPKTEIYGDTQFFGNSPSNWEVSNEANFKLARIVPFPAAAWMGLALLGGLGLTRRLRRRNQS